MRKRPLQRCAMPFVKFFQSVVGKGNEFLPAENCFELFGVDFLLKRSKGGLEKESLDFEAIVLEVNSGPGLEGRVDEILCEDILMILSVLSLIPGTISSCKLRTQNVSVRCHEYPFQNVRTGIGILGHSLLIKNQKCEGMKESPFLVSTLS